MSELFSFCNSRSRWNSHLMDIVTQTVKKKLLRQMKVSPACPGSITRWCSTPALWILFSQHFPSNSVTALLAGPVQRRGPTALCTQDEGGLRSAGGFLTLQLVLYNFCTLRRKTAAANLILRQHSLNENLECAEIPAVCGEVASNVYVYIYILTRQCVVFPLLSVLCCAVFLCFSCAVIIKTFLISFGHWLFSPYICFLF